MLARSKPTRMILDSRRAIRSAGSFTDRYAPFSQSEMWMIGKPASKRRQAATNRCAVFSSRGDAPSRADFSLPLLFDLNRIRLGKCQRTPHQCRWPAEVPGRLGDCLGFKVDLHHLPDSNAMAEHICLPAADRVAKPDSRILLFQRLFLQIKAAQGGCFHMAALCLAAKQRSVVFVNPARLHNSGHA